MSNIAYLRFIEIARTHLAEELGLRLAEMAEKQTYPVVVRTEIDYRHAAKLGDRLMIEGWLDQVERARFWPQPPKAYASKKLCSSRQRCLRRRHVTRCSRF